LNPKLCPHKINSLKQYANVADWDEQDVSLHNNGDKEACNTDKLEIELVQSSAHYAVIRFQNFAAKLDDPRSLLYYLINYREANHGNVTMFDGRDGCNSQNDVWMQVEETPAKTSLNSSLDDYQKVIIEVKPATRYALYVKTFTISAGSPGALSDMMYFETAPDTPGIPRKLESDAISHDTVSISWLPPSKPNGRIVHYIVTIKNTPEYEELQSLDVCGSIIGRDTITKTISQSEPNQSTLLSSMPNNDTNSGAQSNDGSLGATQTTSCARLNPDANLEIQESKVTFQDTIIDIVYLKNTCPTPSSNKPAKEKKKRSIEHDPTETDGISENSLPRKSVNSNHSSSRVPANTEIRSRSHTPMMINFNRSNYKTEARVIAPQTKSEQPIKHLIVGLEHFKLYEIEVIACHGEFNGTKTRPSSTYSKCGLYAVTQVRTKAIPEYDKVNASTIIFYPANETNGNTITWEKPSNPNGLSLAFRVRYRLKNANLDVWNEVCINNTAYERDRGLTLSNIGPGEYVLSVQTVSMYTEQRLWSDEIVLEIPQTNMLSPLSWSLIIITTIVLIALGVAFGAYYTRKKARDDLIYASVNPDYVQYKPDEWEVDKSKLIVGAQIGTGSFGMVYKGQLITEKGIRDCAVKTVPPTSTAKQRFDFLREASIMKQFDTFHVVKLLGVVSVTTPVYVIMEYMENGDLKDFLRNQREIHQKQNKNLVDGIYLMAAQIADGMAYLASKKFVHRDLAARNCMVGENRIVKVGDFGLTRDIYANDYYRRDTQGRLPVRWMAPESLSDNICTSASDAWSYGIVLWEIVTFSAYPYQGLSNDEVIKRVIQGYTMPRPEHCPDKLYNIMERCWRKNDRDRPTFLDIVEYLLPDTEGKLYPNCYYRKPKVEGDSIAQTIPDDSNTGTESYPLLSWPSSNRANGLTNGENHIMNHNHSSDHGEK
jgi:insulin receptor